MFMYLVYDFSILNKSVFVSSNRNWLMQSVCQVNWHYFRQAQLNIFNIPPIRARVSFMYYISKSCTHVRPWTRPKYATFDPLSPASSTEFHNILWKCRNATEMGKSCSEVENSSFHVVPNNSLCFVTTLIYHVIKLSNVTVTFSCTLVMYVHVAFCNNAGSNFRDCYVIFWYHFLLPCHFPHTFVLLYWLLLFSSYTCSHISTQHNIHRLLQQVYTAEIFFVSPKEQHENIEVISVTHCMHLCIWVCDNVLMLLLM